MPGYPILLNLTNRSIVIIGGGRVAARKAEALLEADAQITVISPVLHDVLLELAQAGKICHQPCAYEPGMLTQVRPMLVFAATDMADVNQAAADEAEALGILVNVVNDPTASSFGNMVTVQRPPFTAALATSGASPALAARLKTRLEQVITDADSDLASWLGEMRPLVKARLEAQAERESFWRALMDSDAPALVRDGNRDAAYNVAERLLQERASRRHNNPT